MASRTSMRTEFLEQEYQLPVNNNNNDEKNKKIKQLSKLITHHLTKHKTYHLRPVKIDGITCYVVIHSKYKIVNFESINIKCLVTKNNKKKKQAYSLLYIKYKTIEDALNKIENIVAKYKVYNGDLVSLESYMQLKLEEVIIPYSEEQVCSICNDNTTDMTLCKHYICLHCREQCIFTNNMNCPVCRNEEVVHIYNTDNGMINNSSYPILEFAIEYENDNSNHDYIDLSNQDDDSTNSDTDNDSVNEQETIINTQSNEEENNQEDEVNDEEPIDLIIDRQPSLLPIISHPYRMSGVHISSTSNVTIRNRHYQEFNNNLDNDLLYETQDIELQDTNDNVYTERMQISELSTNDEIEEGEIISNQTVQHKNVV